MLKVYKIVLFLGLILLISCQSQQADNADNLSVDLVTNSVNADGEQVGTPAFKFEHTEFDFGQLNQGEKVIHVFKFVNSGNADLLIHSASASCGCTVPKYPDGMIKPGASGEIEVKFDSKGKHGVQNKVVTIVANTEPNMTELKIKAIVE